MATRKKKIKAAKKLNKWVEVPAIVESYDADEIPDIIKSKIDFTYRLKGEVIDEPAYVKGPPKYIPPHDSFLAYLEWKSKKGFFERLFLP